ncbi:MAG TPA: thiamine phosphate synthase [Rhodospirillales bacterium]|nr:thiamine phosphate synthase [Rhodospirillales bacterium]
MLASLADAARRLKRGSRQGSRGARLPACILIADSGRLADPGAAIAALPRGSAVILRDYDVADRMARAARLSRLCRRRRLHLLVAGDARLAVAVGAQGLHLPEGLARSADRRWRLWRKPGWLVTAAAHSPRAIALARRAGVDAVLLSPVFPTASHPGAATLGPVLFAAWTRKAPLPVYALGGMTAATTRRLSGSGAAGIAAIGGFAASSARR